MSPVPVPQERPRLGSQRAPIPPSTVTYQQNATSGLYFRADVAHNAASNTRYSPVNVTANSSAIDSWL